MDVPARAGQVATAAVAAGGEAARVHGLVLVVGDRVGVLAVELGEAEVQARVAVTWALLDTAQPVAGGRS